MLKDFNDFIGGLYGLGGAALTGLSAIVVGYVFRGIKSFPNSAIPVLIIVWSGAVSPLLADPYAPPQNLRLWLAKNIVIGILVGFIAWRLHKTLLKNLEDKIPFLKGILDDSANYKAGQPGWEKQPINPDPKERIKDPPTLSQVDSGVTVTTTPGPPKRP